MISWTIPYEAGRVEARGLVGGEVEATRQLQTAGLPASLRLTADRKIIQADGRDLAYVDVEVVDRSPACRQTSLARVRTTA